MQSPCFTEVFLDLKIFEVSVTQPTLNTPEKCVKYSPEISSPSTHDAGAPPAGEQPACHSDDLRANLTTANVNKFDQQR